MRKVILRKTVTIDANSYKGVDISTVGEVEDGYTMSFLVGYALNNTNISVYNFYLYSTEIATISLKNNASSSQTVNIIVYGVAEKNFIY